MHIRSALIAIGFIAIFVLPATAQNTNISGLTRIAAAKSVRVCIWPDYFGISYRNPKTQQLSGIDIDMAHELGKDLGVAIEFVDSSFAKLIDDVTQDRCDVAMFAIGITPIRAEKLRFTKPHLASDILRHHQQNQPAYQGLGRYRQSRFCGGRAKRHFARTGDEGETEKRPAGGA